MSGALTIRAGRPPRRGGTFPVMASNGPIPQAGVDFYFDYLSPFAYFAALRFVGMAG
ncbi:MAG: hypothetical protein VCE43_11595 [Myxococcota bacterium]